MSRLDADSPQAMHNVPPFTDKQREKLRAFFEANPDAGYKTALALIGIKATRPAAKAAVLGDDDLAESIERYKGLHEASLDVKLGSIAMTDGHKDQLNAIKYANAIKHGVTEKQSVELVADVKVETEDRSASLAELAAVLKRSGALDDS